MGGGIPDRWLPYSPMGSVIPGTRFIACKVPLKEALLRSLPKKERFGPKNLMEAFPKMGLLIDLTNTTRYYSMTEFTDKKIKYEKIFCPGKVTPPNSIVKQFFRVVDDYLEKEEDPDAVIAVHCTHGINRTGYFICRYMIERLNMLPDEALRNFESGRGHAIERETYVDDLKNGCKGGNESDLRFCPKSSIGGRGRYDQRRNSSYNYKSSLPNRSEGSQTNTYKNGYMEANSRNNEHKRWPRHDRGTDEYPMRKRRFTNKRRKETDIQTNWRDHERFENTSFHSDMPLHQRRGTLKNARPTGEVWRQGDDMTGYQPHRSYQQTSHPAAAESFDFPRNFRVANRGLSSPPGDSILPKFCLSGSTKGPPHSQGSKSTNPRHPIDANRTYQTSDQPFRGNYRGRISNAMSSQSFSGNSRERVSNRGNCRGSFGRGHGRRPRRGNASR